MVNEHMKSREVLKVTDADKPNLTLYNSDINKILERLVRGEEISTIVKTANISVDEIKKLVIKKGYKLLWMHRNVAAPLISNIPLVVKNIVGDLNKGLLLSDVLQKYGFEQNELYNKLSSNGYNIYPISYHIEEGSLAISQIGSFTLVRNIEDGFFHYIKYLNHVTLTTVQINTLLGVNSIYYSLSSQNKENFKIKEHYFHLNKYEIENICKADPSLSFLRNSPYLFTFKGLLLIAKNAKREGRIENNVLKEFFAEQLSLSLRKEELDSQQDHISKSEYYCEFEKWTNLSKEEIIEIVEENLAKGKSLIDISDIIVKDRSLRSSFVNKLMKKLEDQGYIYDTKATRWMRKLTENEPLSTSEEKDEEMDLVTKLVSLINSGKPMHFVVQDHGLSTHQARSMFKSAGYVFSSRTYKWEKETNVDSILNHTKVKVNLSIDNNLNDEIQSTEVIKKEIVSSASNAKQTDQEGEEKITEPSNMVTSSLSSEEVLILKQMISEWKEEKDPEQHYDIKIKIKKPVFNQLNAFSELEELTYSKIIEKALIKFFAN